MNENNDLVRKTYGNRCIYFTGLVQPICKAGVAYDDILDRSNLPNYSLPCVKSHECSDLCSSVHYPSETEIDARIEWIEHRSTQISQRMRDGQCVHCGKSTSSMKVVRGCMYAVPCGCRVGQVAQ